MAGKYFEDLSQGMTFRHALGRTITEADNIFFCALTMNTQPLHLNEEYAQNTPFGTRIVNGLLTLALTVGLTVSDLTEGTIIANLGYENVQHPRPVFHGDTLHVTSEVLTMRPSDSKPDRGVVRLRHIAYNQKGEAVCIVERSVLFLRRPAP